MPWHGTNLVQSCGDGTRESRFEGRDGEQLVGHQMHPDCARWILQEIMVPRTVQTLKKIVYLIRKLNLLGAEVYTEQFRCVSDGSIQRLTYATYPEASKGKSGYWLYKYWFTILLLLDGVALCLVFFVTDHCSVGVSAGKMFNTPSAELLALGCSYLGLPLDDYKYYACYCRPAVRANTHGIGFSGYGFAVPYLVLPPSMYCPDVRHWFRLVRNNLNGLGFLVFFCEKQGTVQGSQVASMHSLLTLSRERNSYGVPLKDICTINSYADFKDDAALELVSAKVIALLPDHDKATRLALEAAHHIAKVYTELKFCNPDKMVEYAWRAAGIWQLQARYVRHVSKIPRPSDCLPSNQFETSVEMWACVATNHVLLFFRHCEQLKLSWTQAVLHCLNSDQLEGTHGAGRTAMGNEVNFTFARWCQILSALAEDAECEADLRARGVEFSAPKHKKKVAQGKINLGTLPCNVGDELGISNYCMPETYHEFVEDMIAARERGLQWARDRYISMFRNLPLLTM
jgi:hypothetical protein